MTNENKSTDRTQVLVFVVFAATAGTAFAIQAWMTFGFGDEVWKIPDPLAVALIVALDLFAIMFMVLSYLLRGSGWPRFVASSVFLFAIGAQVAAAEMFGEYRRWSTEIRVFAALPAVLLALSQEGVILWRTHRADAAGKQAANDTHPDPTPNPRREHPTREHQAAGAAPARERPARTAPAPAPPAVKAPGQPKRPGVRGRQIDPAEQNRRDLVAAHVTGLGGGKQVKQDAADTAGVSTRTIEMWVQSWKDRGQPVRVDPDQPTETQPPIVETQPAEIGNPQLTKGVNV